MNTERAPAVRALPARGFLGNKFPNTEFLNIAKVFDHAHVIFSAIAFVQMHQSWAGVVPAGEAKSFISNLKASAILDFASNSGNCHIGIIKRPAAWAFVLLS